VILKGFNGLLHWQTQTNTFFSKEISDRVRVIACLTTIPNIIHSDSKSDTITSSEWQKVSKAVNASNDDTMVIVWGSEEDTTTAVKEIIIRAHEATIGIPSETRQALSDGTNGFERILPGADRMYPDTDLPPKKIVKERLDKIKLWVPEQFWKRQQWYSELEIPPDTIEELSISKYAELFKKALFEWKINPTTTAVFLIQYPKRLKKNGCMIECLSAFGGDENIFYNILKAFSEGKIPQDALLKDLKTVAELGVFTEEVIQSQISEQELEKEIARVKDEMSTLKIKRKENYPEILMGMLMKKVRGRIDAKIVAKKVGFLGKVKFNG
jgi:glutamyl-tRNA(Gln) amidotransferase subunit E